VSFWEGSVMQGQWDRDREEKARQKTNPIRPAPARESLTASLADVESLRAEIRELRDLVQRLVERKP
jgi:hypothetical protein